MQEKPAASLCSLERVVRPAPTERWSPQRTDVDSGGGMMGAAAGKARTEERTGRKEERAGRANGDRLAIGNPTRETQGLTDSSSATEAGEKRLNHGTSPTASLCSLERVVRGRQRVFGSGARTCGSGGRTADCHGRTCGSGRRTVGNGGRTFVCDRRTADCDGRTFGNDGRTFVCDGRTAGSGRRTAGTTGRTPQKR